MLLRTDFSAGNYPPSVYVTPTAGNDTAKVILWGLWQTQNHRVSHYSIKGQFRAVSWGRNEESDRAHQLIKGRARLPPPGRCNGGYYFVVTLTFVGGLTVDAVTVKKSLRSVALAAPPRRGVIPKISWIVRSVEL